MIGRTEPDLYQAKSMLCLNYEFVMVSKGPLFRDQQVFGVFLVGQDYTGSWSRSGREDGLLALVRPLLAEQVMS